MKKLNKGGLITFSMTYMGRSLYHNTHTYINEVKVRSKHVVQLVTSSVSSVPHAHVIVPVCVKPGQLAINAGSGPTRTQ